MTADRSEQQVLYSSDGVIVFVRWNDGEKVLVAMNRADHDASIHFIDDATQLQKAVAQRRSSAQETVSFGEVRYCFACRR